MRKFIGLVLVGCLVFGSIVSANAETKFKDLKSTNWAYKYVSPLTEKNIVKGYSDGSFKPQGTVTYGEFIKLCVVASMGKDIGNSKTGNWAKSYYDKALELGFFKRNEIKEEQLNKQIPRYDMALIISSADNYISGGTVKYALKSGDKDLSLKDVVCQKLSDLSDSTNNIDEIVNVYAGGIINGYDDGSFKPNNTLTRAESSTVVYRLIEKSSRETPNFKLPCDVDTFLNSVTPQGDKTIGEFLGVSSAEQLKKEKPMTYYSFAIPTEEKKPISEMITNGNEIKSATFDCEYYKIVNPKDISITSITKVTNKFNEEAIEVLPGDGATNAFLIKDKKVICNLSSADGDGMNKASLFFPESTTYYNGATQNTKLMDFDYIGFWGSTGDTIFLVSNPF